MKLTVWKTVLAASCLCAASETGSGLKVERHPLQIGAVVDIGQIVKGEDEDLGARQSTDGKMIQRTSVYLNQFTTVNERLEIKVGVGGMFLYGYPEEIGTAGSRNVKFGPGIGQAQAVYKFGKVENPLISAHFGLFPYKYNPDAKNLGEYLMRSGTYPGYQLTGGWQIINSAAYFASGLSLHANFLSGKLGADLNVFMERDLGPIYDLSPGLVLSYKPASVIEFGAGAQFAHLIPVAPSKEKSRNIKYDHTRQDTIINGTDTTIFLGPIVVTSTTSGGGLLDSATAQSYTFKGTKLMGRLALNFGALLNSPFIGPDGLKFYTEVALLGVKNYPYYYEDRLQRMPILLGVNLPTFGFFDMLAVEYEYRKWGFPNSAYTLQDSFEPLNDIPGILYLDSTLNPAGDTVFVENDWRRYNPDNPVYWIQKADGSYQKVSASEGNQKWTVYAKKRFMPGFTVYVQAASDHYRDIRNQDFTLSRNVITSKPNQWYYLVRLEFGI